MSFLTVYRPRKHQALFICQFSTLPWPANNWHRDVLHAEQWSGCSDTTSRHSHATSQHSHETSRQRNVTSQVITVTPQVDTVMPQFNTVMPQVDTAMPQVEAVTFQVNKVTPQVNKVMPQADLVTPQATPLNEVPTIEVPVGEEVIWTCVTPRRVHNVQVALQKEVNRHRCAVRLLPSFFTREELSTSNTDSTHGKQCLDSEKLNSIKVLVFSKFPVECAGRRDRLWRFIKTKINARCHASKFATRDHGRV